MIWCETSEPNIKEARRFAAAIHATYPGKLLAYNCSPSFHWKAKLNEWEISLFQRELGAMGYRFQFVTLAGFHALNLSCLTWRTNTQIGMSAYSQLQQREFELAERVRLRRGEAPAIRWYRLLRRNRQHYRFRTVLHSRPSWLNGRTTI